MDGIPSVPKISFVVAMHDHAEDFGRHVDSVIDQTLSPSDYEIVFADSCHVLDLRRELERARARKDPRLELRFERVSKGGRATAVNGGIRLARAPIILLFAHDAIAPPNTAEAHLRFHQENPERNRVGAGSLLVPPALRSRFVTWLEQSGELFGVPFSHDMTSVPENFFYIAHCSAKRDFLLEAGLFDESFPAHAWDDFELGCRLTALPTMAQHFGRATGTPAHEGVTVAHPVCMVAPRGPPVRLLSRAARHRLCAWLPPGQGAGADACGCRQPAILHAAAVFRYNGASPT
jgi:glycosyltransferase involved in cell wall biosynthesis